MDNLIMSQLHWPTVFGTSLSICDGLLLSGYESIIFSGLYQHQSATASALYTNELILLDFGVAFIYSVS